MDKQTTSDGSAAPAGVSSVELLQCLPSIPSDLRAGALSSLLSSDQPDTRRRAVAIAAAVLTDEEIEDYLREGADAGLRNGALEALKIRSRNGTRLALRLLKDDDPDVVLQAVLALTHGRDPAALEDLRRALHHSDPNVVQAAIIAIGQIGDHRFEADLLPFLEAESWLQMAAVQAIGDLGTSAALPALEALIDHPGVGPMAAEAITRIGGDCAFQILGRRWVESRISQPSLIPTTSLAYVAEANEDPFPTLPGLRQGLVAFLEHSDIAEACAAAQVLLSLGPGPGDLRSMGILARHRNHSNELPRCLERRFDLVPTLLLLPGAPRCWGLALAARKPDVVGFTDLKIALAELQQSLSMKDVAIALIGNDDPRMGAITIRLFADASITERQDLVAAVRHHGQVIRASFEDFPGLNEATRLALRAILDGPVEGLAAQLDSLDVNLRPQVVALLGSRPEVVAALPWQKWMMEDASGTCTLIAIVLRQGSSQVTAVSDLLEETVSQRPTSALVRAVSALPDLHATRILATLLDHPDQMVRVLALDTLGGVAGADARALLRHRARSGDSGDAQVALMALARIPDPDDIELFIGCAQDRNPAIRLICADALACHSDSRGMSTLVALAADPDDQVAAKATGFLYSQGEKQ